MSASQILLVATLFLWSDFFPPWLNRAIMVSVILFPPLAYLTVFIRPAMRQAWHSLLRDFWMLLVSIAVVFIRLFNPASVLKLTKQVASLKPTPTSVDEWITFCILPFKTCVAATFPIIWTFEKITTYFQPYGRSFPPSFELLFLSYLISLLALLLGAGLQAIFCRPGRATTTLRFFLLGFVLLLAFILFPRAI